MVFYADSGGLKLHLLLWLLPLEHRVRPPDRFAPRIFRSHTSTALTLVHIHEGKELHLQAAIMSPHMASMPRCHDAESI